jgi:hypothetical protein
MPGAGGQVFDMPTPTYWKLENGAWCWYIPEDVKVATPFGKMRGDAASAPKLDMKGAAPGGIDNPDVGSLLNQITIDKLAVKLTHEEPQQQVTISNNLPGPLDLQVDAHVKLIKGLSVSVEPMHLEAGAKATVTLRRLGTEKIVDSVVVRAEPFHREFSIRVESN